MKNEFTLAFNEVLEDKGLPKEVILEALESAMVSAYRKSVNASNEQPIEAKIDLETGKVTIYAQKEVVEVVENNITEVELETARKVEPEAQLGDLVVVESTRATLAAWLLRPPVRSSSNAFETLSAKPR